VARLALLDKVLDELFTDEHVRSWRSLIIDLSYNEGGDDQLGLSLAGRLTDTAYLAYTRGGAVLRRIGPAMTQLRMLRWQLCTARRHTQGGRAHSQRAVDADRPATPDDGTGAVRDIERLVKPRVADSLPSVGKSSLTERRNAPLIWRSAASGEPNRRSWTLTASPAPVIRSHLRSRTRDGPVEVGELPARP
jgi:hypothetical protein